MLYDTIQKAMGPVKDQSNEENYATLMVTTYRPHTKAIIV